MVEFLVLGICSNRVFSMGFNFFSRTISERASSMGKVLVSGQNIYIYLLGSINSKDAVEISQFNTISQV